MDIIYKKNSSSYNDIEAHLNRVSDAFIPSLRTYISIPEYSKKLSLNAQLFEAYHQTELIGLIAGYHVHEKATFYISNVSVDTIFTGKGIIKHLFTLVYHYCNDHSINTISLQVYKQNTRAIAIYFKQGFEVVSENSDRLELSKKL